MGLEPNSKVGKSERKINIFLLAIGSTLSSNWQTEKQQHFGQNSQSKPFILIRQLQKPALWSKHYSQVKNWSSSFVMCRWRTLSQIAITSASPILFTLGWLSQANDGIWMLNAELPDAFAGFKIRNEITQFCLQPQWMPLSLLRLKQSLQLCQNIFKTSENNWKQMRIYYHLTCAAATLQFEQTDNKRVIYQQSFRTTGKAFCNFSQESASYK